MRVEGKAVEGVEGFAPLRENEADFCLGEGLRVTASMLVFE
jgi:hypothetical protein